MGEKFVRSLLRHSHLSVGSLASAPVCRKFCGGVAHEERNHPFKSTSIGVKWDNDPPDTAEGATVKKGCCACASVSLALINVFFKLAGCRQDESRPIASHNVNFLKFIFSHGNKLHSLHFEMVTHESHINKQSLTVIITT